jgi:hypothetical protein
VQCGELRRSPYLAARLALLRHTASTKAQQCLLSRCPSVFSTIPRSSPRSFLLCWQYMVADPSR